MFLRNVHRFCVLLLFFISAVNGSIKTGYVFDHLLRNYNENIKPDGKVTVHHSMTLTNIINYENHILTANVWIQQVWNDSRLKWNPTQSNTKLNIPHRLLWKPDIVLYNNAGVDDGIIYKDLNVVLSSDGLVSYTTPMRLVTQCSEQGSGFLSWKATCKWKFGSWTYNGIDIDIDNGTYFNMDEFLSNPKFEVINTGAMRNEQYYTCCPEPYVDVTYTLEFRRAFDDDK